MAAQEPKSIAEEINELRAMSVAGLVERYTELHGKPPRSKNKAWLWRRCAWKVQEQRFGGLSQVARRRIDEIVAGMDLPFGKPSTVRGSIESSRPSEAVTGTVLTREWRGVEIRATKVDGGWEHEGIVYRSLSGLVKSVTGSHCSGRAWFGLAPKKGAAR